MRPSCPRLRIRRSSAVTCRPGSRPVERRRTRSASPDDGACERQPAGRALAPDAVAADAHGVDTERLRGSSGGERRTHALGLAAVNADAEVMRYINDGVPLTRVESGIGSDRVAEHWRTYGFGLWAVVERSSDAMVGFAGLSHPLWLPGWERTVEVGWRLHP